MHSRYLAGCSIAVVAMMAATPAMAQQQRAFDLPSQPLPSAIAALGKQARLQIVAPADGLDKVTSRPVKGLMDARTALRQLIAGTGLEIVSEDSARVVLRRTPARKVSQKQDSMTATAADDIVVSGFRASMTKANEIKRKSDAIVDVVAAEDIGQLPDNSATEALARLPGVQIFRNRGEGQSITIRGISNVVTMINGQEAYTGSSRRTLLNSYPSGLIRSMSIYKALTPDLIEGGVGGAVDVQLYQPLDFKKGLSTAGTLRGSYDDQADKAFYNADILVNGNWDTAAGEIGVMVNASFLRRDYYESYRENLQPQTVGGQRFPTGILLKNPAGNYKRPVITGELQWRPAYNFGMHIRATNVTDDNSYTDTDLQTNMASSTALSNVVLVPGTNIVKSATFTATADSGPRSNHTRQLLDTTQIEAGADFTSGIATLTTNAVYTTSRIDTDQQLFLLGFNQAPVIDAVFQGDSKYGGLSYTYRNVDLSNINNFHVRAYSDTRTREKGKGLQWRTDLNLDTGDGFFRQIKMGVRYARRSADYQTGTGLADLNSLKLPMSAFPGGTTPVGLTRSVSSDDAVLPSGWVGYDASWLSNIDNVKALNALVDSKLTTKLYTDDGRPPFDPKAAFYGSEASYAAYAQFKYGFSLGGIPIDGVAGARLVNTVLSIDGTQYAVSRAPSTGNVNTTTYTPVHGRQNYIDFDPSLSAVAHFSPKIQLRLAWTRTFSRPDFNQLNPSQTFAQVLTAAGAYSGKVTSGNPDLRPIRSTNWDASLEGYFGRAGSASLALFRHDVENYITTAIEKDSTIPGALGIVDVTHPINAGKGVIQGIELNASTFFDFAPGILRNFGASANYTYTDSRQEILATNSTAAFTGQTAGISKHAYNAALFYDDGTFRAKIAYSWRGRFTLAYNLADASNNLNWYPIERLAASLTYRFNRNIALTVDGTNLTNRPQRSYWGSEAFQDRVYFEGRTYSAALRFKF